MHCQTLGTFFSLKKKYFFYKSSYSTCSRNRISPIKCHFTKVKHFKETKFHLMISTNRPYKGNSTKSSQNYSTVKLKDCYTAKLTYDKYFQLKERLCCRFGLSKLTCSSTATLADRHQQPHKPSSQSRPSGSSMRLISDSVFQKQTKKLKLRLYRL